MGGDDPEAVRTFLATRPDRERALEAVLAVDAEHDTWTFDDVDVDSGTFGELVSRGIVAKADGAYRLADPSAVEAALTGAITVENTDDEEAGLSEGIVSRLGAWGDRSALAGLIGALALLFVMRVLNVRSVFQGEYVVSPGNDPYFYRYWVGELLTASDGVTDLGLLANLPDGAASRRPFTHAANWFLAELLGGDQWAADVVAAWLPVVGALALGVVLYCLAVVMTRDVRVGLATVVLFALTPVHAVYSGIGFIEHRLHQYFWLGITLLTLAWLAMDVTRRRSEASSVEAAVRAHLARRSTWVAAASLGLALGISAHTWGGSVLLFVPLSAYVALKVVVDLRDDVPVGRANLPLLGGVGLGGAIAAFLHFSWGWHEPYAGVVPLLVFLGSAGVVALAALWRRTGWPIATLLATQGLIAAFGLVGFRTVRPGDWELLMNRADDLLFREGATETASLFDPELAFVLGPVSQIGVEFYIAVGFVVWALWAVARRYEPAWLLLAVYSVFWLVMAAIQGRFAAHLAISMSVFAGLGFVYLLSWVDLARTPATFDGGGETRPTTTDGETGAISGVTLPREARTVAYLFGIGLLVFGLSLVFVPSLAAQTAHSDAQLEAALVIEDHADEHDREWRDNAAFSSMGDNRMYNYFISGESRQYRYVQSMYPQFVADDDPDGWKSTLDGRFGYAIASEERGLSPARLGAGGERTLDHYQLLYLSDDGDLAAFAIVEGATIEGMTASDEPVTVRTGVEVDGAAFTYERDVNVDEGTFSVTVPYPGEYVVGDESVEVSEEDVESGGTVRVEG